MLARLSAWLKRYDPARSWLTAAEANGLTRIQVKSFLWMTTSLEGWQGPLHVTMKYRYESAQGAAATVRITVSGIARGLALRPEGIDTRFRKELGRGGDITTGDARFDRELFVTGSAPLVHALLDADTRTALRRLFAGSMDDLVSVGSVPVKVGVGGGAIIVDFQSEAADAHVPGTLEATLAVAQRLLEPDDVGGRIARNALEDRADGVRQQCLLALIAEHRGHAAFRETLRRACDDANEDVRLQAALGLAEEGLPTLRALASSAEAEQCAAGALSALGIHLETADALALLDASLGRRRLAVATACIEALNGRGGAAAAAVLERVLAGESGPLAAAAAAALGRVGTATAVLAAAGGGRARGRRPASRGAAGHRRHPVASHRRRARAAQCFRSGGWRGDARRRRRRGVAARAAGRRVLRRAGLHQASRLDRRGPGAAEARAIPARPGARLPRPTASPTSAPSRSSA